MGNTTFTRISIGVLGALLLAPSARSEVLMTEEQALKLMFPKSASVERQARPLSDEQRSAVEKKTGLRFPEREFRFFVGRTKDAVDGYAVVMNEIGKHEFITFMVGITPQGAVSETAVLVFRESRGWEVKEQRFLRQFRGKTRKDPIQVNRDIVNYSGATLSSHAIARGVRRALALVEVFYGYEKTE